MFYEVCCCVCGGGVVFFLYRFVCECVCVRACMEKLSVCCYLVTRI
jgi:hypothetical protein